jgi:hypothetical protein
MLHILARVTRRMVTKGGMEVVIKNHEDVSFKFKVLSCKSSVQEVILW